MTELWRSKRWYTKDMTIATSRRYRYAKGTLKLLSASRHKCKKDKTTVTCKSSQTIDDVSSMIIMNIILVAIEWSATNISYMSRYKLLTMISTKLSMLW